MTVSINTEIVTRSFEGFESADMEKFTSDWAPDIVFDVSGYEHWPLEQTEFHGSEEVVFVRPVHVERAQPRRGYELRGGQFKHVWVFTDQGRAKAFSQEVSG